MATLIRTTTPDRLMSSQPVRPFFAMAARVLLIDDDARLVDMLGEYLRSRGYHVDVRGDGESGLLTQSRDDYDAVILDAFLGDSSPSHLMTRESFASIRRVLRPGGTLVINAFCSVEDGNDFFAASLTKTLASVFPGVKLHTAGPGQIYFVATDRPDPAFVRAPDIANVHPDALPYVQAAVTGTVEPIASHGLVLTDDYNPVEYYDAHNRENLRRYLVREVRQL